MLLLVPAAGHAQPTSVADAIRTILTSGRLDAITRPELAAERDLLDLLYAPGGYTPLWLANGRPSARGNDALAALQAADTKGLDPRDYDAGLLAAEAARLTASRDPSGPTLARFDAALSVELVRLLADLHLGRVDPRPLGFDYDRGPKRKELGALMTELSTQTPVGEIVDAAAPRLLENLLLERQLERYRRLAGDPEVAEVLLTPTIRPGSRLDAAPQLARWLTALGDLSPDAPLGTGYQGALVEAVQRFQLRHGLAPDGVIGLATARALAVSAAARARQIELALERLRWLPGLARDRTVIVNVPGFELLAFDEIGAGRDPALHMSVVVGRALHTQTPFFADAMTDVVFAPYWSVPSSILQKEILPKLRKEPDYLAKEQMEIVSDGQVLAPTPDAIARLGRGGAELRQRPGPKNALGRVKFLFPNPYDVYMHDTPARELFARSRRDFSHGCIRLADAAALANWVLAGEGWERSRVDELLAREQQTRVPLRRSIAVVIAYATAVARLDGTITFYDDVYEHDAALERALAERAYR